MVYFRAKLRIPKFQKNAFSKIESSYKGGANGQKLTRPEKLKMNSRGGGYKVREDGNVRLNKNFTPRLSPLETY